MAQTRAWVTRVVVGLNLCPFAQTPWARDQVRVVVSEATQAASLLTHLESELHLLAESDPQKIETTLLVHPQALTDFFEFNEFLDMADQLLESLALSGVIQVASFHPQYQFAHTEPSDVANATNRSPYPTLHLLREASVEWAVGSVASTEAIFEANIRTLEQLGAQGWAALQAQCQTDALNSNAPNQPSDAHAAVQRN
jgi:uncharacterized protein